MVLQRKIVFAAQPLKMKAKAQLLHKRAGLIFPVRRVYGILKDKRITPRIAIAAAIYLTAVLEYLSSEILELAGKAAVQNNKKRIYPRHVLLAIRNDDELNLLLKGVVFTQGGVVPNIESVLLPKKTVIRKAQSEPNVSSQEY